MGRRTIEHAGVHPLGARRIRGTVMSGARSVDQQ
jgi:hypothetical protein